jgi:hypothetical protein
LYHRFSEHGVRKQSLISSLPNVRQYSAPGASLLVNLTAMPYYRHNDLLFLSIAHIEYAIITDLHLG